MPTLQSSHSACNKNSRTTLPPRSTKLLNFKGPKSSLFRQIQSAPECSNQLQWLGFGLDWLSHGSLLRRDQTLGLRLCHTFLVDRPEGEALTRLGPPLLPDLCVISSRARFQGPQRSCDFLRLAAKREPCKEQRCEKSTDPVEISSILRQCKANNLQDFAAQDVAGVSKSKITHLDGIRHRDQPSR